MLHLDYRDSRPIYEQVQDGLRKLMVAGVLQEGEKLPSVRALAGQMAINPNTVLREVMDNVDLSRRIVYILCAVILVMNLFVVSVIALLNMYDSRREIALMRLIGISMKKINRLYLIQNALAGLAAAALSLGLSRLCLLAIRRFVASMGIVLDAARVYPMEWVILLAVFLLSIIPTVLCTHSMSRRATLEA